MKLEQTKARAATQAQYNLNFKRHYKRMPAFSKPIKAMRQSGRVPANRVMVTFDWDLARAYPRIVLADDTPPEELEFGYLAGLAIQVCYRAKDSHRVSAVVDAIMSVRPASFATFAVDLAGTGVPAATLLVTPANDMSAREVA